MKTELLRPATWRGDILFQKVIQSTGAKQSGSSYLGHCPCHDDKSPSLKVDLSASGKVLLHCFAGCGKADLGEWLRSQYESHSQGHREKRTAYFYADSSGVPILKVERIEAPGQKKRFVQLHRAGQSWVPGKPAMLVCPYRYSEWKDLGEIYLVEGEKCADSLRELGFAATTTPGGSSGWKSHYADAFRGKAVVIIPDNDEPGFRYARNAFKDLFEVAAVCGIYQVKGLGPGEDVADWIERGGTKEELLNELVMSPSSYDLDIPDSSTAHSDIIDFRSLNKGSAWPDPVGDRALWGPIGKLVAALEPDTEADPAAILFQMLTIAGCAIGRGAWIEIEGAKQCPNLFTLIVGKSAKARKGTSLGRVKEMFRRIDSEFLSNNLASGLSSGEGVIARVRDKQIQTAYADSGLPVETTLDEGVPDKRVCFIESELASVMQVLRREGSKLSAVLRDAFDGSDLAVLTRGASLKATEPHVSIIAHVTAEELRSLMRSVDAFNGFANRFLFIASKRSKLLPLGRPLDVENINPILQEIKDGIEFGKNIGRFEIAETAKELFATAYRALSEERFGLYGALTSRAEVMALRVAMIFAAIDKSKRIELDHMRAGFAAWEYADASARHFFGNGTGNPVADKILEELKVNPTGLNQTQIAALFSRNLTKTQIGAALSILEEAGEIAGEKIQQNKGRPSTVWKALKALNS